MTSNLISLVHGLSSEKCSFSEIPAMSDGQPGIKLAGKCRSGTDASRQREFEILTELNQAARE
jgi:hypothetical protein